MKGKYYYPFRKLPEIIQLVGLTFALLACGAIPPAPTLISASQPTLSSQSATPKTSTPLTLPLPTSPSKTATTQISAFTSPTFTVTPVALRTLPVFAWQSNWIKGVPCRAPCWEGITPGKTTLQEALDLLKHNPRINPSNISPATLSNVNVDRIYWQWALPGNDDGGVLFAHKNSSSQMIVSQVAPINYTPYKLADVIKVYGEPNYMEVKSVLLPDYDGPVHEITVIFITSGFVLQGTSLLNDFTTKADISPDLTLKLMYYFEPSENGYNNTLKEPTDKITEISDQVLRWQGYNSFNFYCRDKQGSSCKNS